MTIPQAQITISVKAWSDIQPKCHSFDKETIDAISDVMSCLDKKQQYVYYASVPFGEKLIENGNIPIRDFSFIPNPTFSHVTKQSLHMDFAYTNDPLGFVTKNHIEVYSLNKRNEIAYNVPMNIIKEGNFFGLFGTLDFLCNREYKQLLTHNQQWNVVAGNVCFHLLFPFDNDTINLYLGGTPYDKYIKKNSNSFNSPEERKISFVKTHLSINRKTWEVEVIYFNMNFMNQIRNNLSSLRNILFKIGWEQSGYLRDTIFENKILSDKIDDLTTVCPNKVFLSSIYNHILKVIRNDAYILSPVSESHILYDACNTFKQILINAQYMSKKNAFHPIVLAYDKLNTNSWGILASSWLPILLNYKLVNASIIRDDLEFIKKEIHDSNENFELKHTTFSNKEIKSKHTRDDRGNFTIPLNPSNQELKDKICELKGYSRNNVCLTAVQKGLSDFLIVKKIEI